MDGFGREQKNAPYRGPFCLEAREKIGDGTRFEEFSKISAAKKSAMRLSADLG